MVYLILWSIIFILLDLSEPSLSLMREIPRLSTLKNDIDTLGLDETKDSEDIDEIKSPVFVICPDPPYKPSFFRGDGRNDTEAADKFFWALPYYSDWFDENTFIAKDFYEKMTYQLESDLLLYMQVYNEK